MSRFMQNENVWDNIVLFLTKRIEVKFCETGRTGESFVYTVLKC